MLDVLDVQDLSGIDGDRRYNYLAPDVYISSIELSKNKKEVKVYFYLLDEVDVNTGQPRWSANSDVINNFTVQLTYSGSKEQTKVKSLNSFVDGKSLKYENYVVFERGEEKISNVIAYCGNDYIVGSKVAEEVLSEQRIEFQGLQYLNKIKDFGLLNPQFKRGSSFTPTLNKNYSEDLYVGYTVDKSANCTIKIDLGKYLTNNSKNYNILQNYKSFFDYISSNSYIKIDGCRLYKKISDSKEDYKITPAIFNSYRLNDNSCEFLVSFTEINENNNSFIYDIKLDLDIFDASEVFFDEYILPRLLLAEEKIAKYRNKLHYYQTHELIEDAGRYFFQNDFDQKEKYINRNGGEIEIEFFAILSDILIEVAEATFVFTDIPVEQLLANYVSCCHPLTTNTNILEQLLKHITDLYQVCAQFSKNVKYSKTVGSSRKEDSSTRYTKIFKNAIDYTYDFATGYEVAVTDNLTARLDYVNSGARVLQPEEREVRKYLESSKYYANPSLTTRNRVSTFSIFTVDLPSNSYLINDLLDKNQIDALNEIYIKAREYQSEVISSKNVKKDFEYMKYYDKYASSVFQFLDDGITVDTLLQKNNTSADKYFKNILFDINGDSTPASEAMIAGSGVTALYLAADQVVFIAPEKPTSDTVIQYNAAYDTSKQQNPKALIDSLTKDDPKLKSRSIFYYNSIFTEEEKYKGSNYSLYSMEKLNVSKLFDGLRHLNQYYIVKYQEEAGRKDVQTSILGVVDDMLYNVIPGAIQNIDSDADYTITVDDI
jgi:hypothetical protein